MMQSMMHVCPQLLMNMDLRQQILAIGQGTGGADDLMTVAVFQELYADPATRKLMTFLAQQDVPQDPSLQSVKTIGAVECSGNCPACENPSRSKLACKFKYQLESFGWLQTKCGTGTGCYAMPWLRRKGSYIYHMAEYQSRDAALGLGLGEAPAAEPPEVEETRPRQSEGTVSRGRLQR